MIKELKNIMKELKKIILPHVPYMIAIGLCISALVYVFYILEPDTNLNKTTTITGTIDKITVDRNHYYENNYTITVANKKYRIDTPLINILQLNQKVTLKVNKDYVVSIESP